MDWITPHVALGNWADAESPTGCDAVLNVAWEVPVSHRLPCLHLTLSDEEPVPPQSLEEALTFLEDRAELGQKVLVHCVAGISRSPSIVAMYLSLTHGWELEEALEYIRERRPEAWPHAAVWESVARFVDSRRA
jgi:hypothetical protein